MILPNRFRLRKITVEAEQIIITQGTSDALGLLAGFFSDPNRTYLLEDPAIPYARYHFEDRGRTLRTLLQDETGALPPEEITDMSLIYLNPSHQFPRGHYLPLWRRFDFLAVVRDRPDSYLLEDDYDSEFRFSGTPYEALYALNPEKVIYLGTFSKSLFPALRLGFMILPETLRSVFIDYKDRIFSVPPYFSQSALARFIDKGYFEKHLFEMKRLYRKRKDRILHHLSTVPDISISGEDCSFHLNARLPHRQFDDEFVRRCAARQLAVRTEAPYVRRPAPQLDRLVIGYGNTDDDALDDALTILTDEIAARSS